jgi:hypothetical protein
LCRYELRHLLQYYVRREHAWCSAKKDAASGAANFAEGGTSRSNNFHIDNKNGQIIPVFPQ